MSLTQQKSREILFQLLYSQEFADNQKEDIIPFLMGQHTVTKKTICQIQERQRVILAKQEEIDQLIRNTSQAYEFHRIPGIEKNILRLGIYEICFDDSIPSKVAISEAIRLARKFATPESATFINAVLDTIYKKVTTQKV